MTSRTFLCAVVVFAVVFGRAGGEPHEGKGEAKGLAVYKPRDLKWADAPRILPPGAQVAILEGDPSKAGPFVMRVRLPDGYRIPPHTHPARERITVISGTFHVVMGDKFDPNKGQAMPAGAFGTWPAKRSAPNRTGRSSWATACFGS